GRIKRQDAVGAGMVETRYLSTRRRDLHSRAPVSRANRHCLIAEVRLGGGSASSLAASISATRALSGHPRSRAAASSAVQNIGSRLVEALWAATWTQLLCG